MASIPKPPEEEKTSKEAEETENGQEIGDKDTEVSNEVEEEQGSPIVNEVEEMEAGDK